MPPQPPQPSLEGFHHGCGTGGGSAVERASKEWAVPQPAPKTVRRMELALRASLKGETLADLQGFDFC